MTNRVIPYADLDAARRAVLSDLNAVNLADAVRTAAVADRCRADAARKVAAAQDAAAWARTCDNLAARKYATDADRDAAAVARADARRAAELAAVALDAAAAADADAETYDADTAFRAVYARETAYLCRVRVYGPLDARADALTAAARDARRTADAQPDNDAARKAADAAERDARKARRDADNDADAIYYAFPIGGKVDARRPYTAGAYRIAWAIVSALADLDAAYKPAAVRVYHDLSDADNVHAAARYVAARTARNAVRREGTPTQWRVDAAARAAEWTQADLADMDAAAADVLTLAAAPAAYVAAVRHDGLVLQRAADLLDKLPPHGYAAARVQIVDAAARRLNVYGVTGDARTDRARARCILAAADAAAALAAAADDDARAAAVAALVHAAYTAVNLYLTDARAIRTNDKPAHVSLDDLNAADAAPLAADYDAARAAAVRQAVRRARATLTPAQTAAFDAAACGYSERQAAARMDVAKTVYHKYLTAARRKIAAALVDADAPADLHAAAAALADGLTAAALDADAAAANAAQDAAALAAAALADADADAVQTTARAALADLDADARAIYAAVACGQAVRAAARAHGIAEATARRKATAAARRILAAAVGVTLPATAADVAAAVALADAVRLSAPYIVG